MGLNTSTELTSDGCGCDDPGNGVNPPAIKTPEKKQFCYFYHCQSGDKVTGVQGKSGKFILNVQCGNS